MKLRVDLQVGHAYYLVEQRYRSIFTVKEIRNGRPSRIICNDLKIMSHPDGDLATEWGFDECYQGSDNEYNFLSIEDLGEIKTRKELREKYPEYFL